MASSFTNKVWISAGITALFVLVILLIKSTFSVFLMILAGSLIALFFHGLAGLIERKLKAGHKASILISIFGTLCLLSILFFFVGTKVQSQVSEQLIIGPLTGYLGIILATPVLLIVITMVQELYVNKQDQA
ncbi:hypothetical protein [Desertivirga arenae]|uniref:hypothetical protein n=1 Tax=Desertivirga arenae TaxID=2810309 RepID=UPI001A95E203|nr:hypothetical protein [Pedobacter sp. SYSU D00823]